MEREKIELDVTELKDIVYGESDLFDIVHSETTGHWRHGSEETKVVKRLSDGKFFELNYRDSVKDSCEFQDMNYSGEYSEVFPEEKTITVYK